MQSYAKKEDMGTWVHGHTGIWRHGYMGTWHGHLAWALDMVMHLHMPALCVCHACTCLAIRMHAWP